MAFPAAMTVRTVACGSSRRSWTPSSRNSSALMRSGLLRAASDEVHDHLGQGPSRITLPGFDIADGDASLQPSDMTVEPGCAGGQTAGALLKHAAQFGAKLRHRRATSPRPLLKSQPELARPWQRRPTLGEPPDHPRAAWPRRLPIGRRIAPSASRRRHFSCECVHHR